MTSDLAPGATELKAAHDTIMDLLDGLEVTSAEFAALSQAASILAIRYVRQCREARRR